LSSAVLSPCSSDDITVSVSNLTSAPSVDTLADDDPSPALLNAGRATNGSLLHPGRAPDVLAPLDEGTEDPDYDDDAFSNAAYGRFHDGHSIALELNAIRVQCPSVIQAYDVTSDNEDDVSVHSIADCTSSKDATEEGEPPTVDDDPDAIRAQIDSGAFASCTDQKHMLHDYREFNESFRCPTVLQPAAEGSDITPQGVGYLHVPALNGRGHIAIRTFYHPQLRTTVIDERDFVRFTPGVKPADFSGDKIQKYNDAGTFTFHAVHRLRRSQDVIVHGLLRHGKCYTGPLIPPNLSREHPMATPSTSSAAAIAADPHFARACERATVQAIYAHQEKEYAHLRDEMSTLPIEDHTMPFHEYIQQNTPVQTIQAKMERLLWHQHLGHPSDYYLFHAHKHVKGVPQFSHEHSVLDRCPTCIQAKQTKEPAGANST